MTKKPKGGSGKRRSRKTPVAGSPEAAPPTPLEVEVSGAAPSTPLEIEATAPADAPPAAPPPAADAPPLLVVVPELLSRTELTAPEPVADLAALPPAPAAPKTEPATPEPVADLAALPPTAPLAAPELIADLAPRAPVVPETVAELTAPPAEPVGSDLVGSTGWTTAPPGTELVESGTTSEVAGGKLKDRRRGGGDRRRKKVRPPEVTAAVATDVGEAKVYSDPEAATLPSPDSWDEKPLIGLVAPAPPAAPAPNQDSSLDPAAAAFEAARIAGEIVGDIESAQGAAIVAAAAAGAAIEAARARRAAGAPPVVAGGEGDGAAGDVPVMKLGPDGLPIDPVTTVRMHRERILRALADDIAANPTLAEGGAPSEDPRSRPAGRAPSHSGQPSPGTLAEGEDKRDGDEDALDPVQIAAAAIHRLRQRASTDFAELRTHYHRHDIVVVVAAFLIIVIAGRIHAGMVTPPNVKFPAPGDGAAAQRGLTFEHSQSWLKAENLPPTPPRIARDPTGQAPKPDGAYHVALTSSVDPNARIEILIDKKPTWSNIVTGLELDRRTRWGELYTLDDSAVREIEDQNWLRTAYRYAHAPEKGDVPRVDRAVEYATIDREQIYVVTLFGSESELARIESVVAPTLRVPTRSGLPLVPQTRSSGRRSYPNPVARAFDSTVMIVVADLVDGRLRARGGGSGVIVGADGSILTNYHVIHDKNGRLHDVFVIGRFSSLDRAPQLQCAGRPNRSKLQRELDLALIKCDTDLDGRTWTPSRTSLWATLLEAKASDVKIGQRLWVLGFPDVGGGGLTLSEGEIGGWTGQDGAAGKDFIKTDASITHGNSGGPVVDDKGKLVGIASASRTRISSNGGVIETGQVGLVRPLSTASDLLAIASIGWTPREGHTDIEIQPSAVEAPAEGIRIATTIIDAANEAPVRDALVMVLRPGVVASTIDVNRLDDQVISWGRSNTQGEVQLKQPVPLGTYTVLVRASGYEPLIGEDKLRLDDKTPPDFDPWGGIKLLAR